ncbi:MAG: 23S rRNA (pseudouridine(1915)-N(3))-methyltransferase RlmH [Methylobacteriaceae bacterium]|nr:23S rRNA (pseudouridine(1915)-N(3))-methyltransferase RlmH [Methylobacteriaceae bacterium]
MRLQILCVGRLKAGPERQLVARYSERIAAAGRAIGLGPLDIREIAEGSARRPDDRKIDEALRIAALLPEGATLWALDETGASLASENFAREIAKLRDDGNACLAFAIGGADGLDDSLRQRANSKIAFGAMTLPHQLVRVLLVEQIYRATTILSGHPYHRG